MPDLDWSSFLNLYGPLALGWPFFMITLLRLFKIHDRTLDALNGNTQALATLAERINALKKG